MDELLRKCSAIRGPSEQRPDKVSHVMDRVVLPLKMRPLRAYAGTMNALSFALSCDPPLLADAADEEAEEKQGGGAEAPAEGRRQWHQAADFFEETVSLVETGFDHLVQPYQADPQTPRSIARARNAALRLMGVVAGLKPHERVQPILNRLNAEPKDGKPHTLYHRMVTVLLRALTSVKPFDVAEARRAMENINRSELPKTVVSPMALPAPRTSFPTRTHQWLSNFATAARCAFPLQDN